MNLGAIFECQREGPDVVVCRHFLSLLNPAVKLDAVPLNNKRVLIQNCATVAQTLLESNDHVVIVWDLIPRWQEEGIKYKLEDECKKIAESLDATQVDRQKVSLVCMVQELEAWFLADYQAIRAVLADLKAPHRIGQVPKHKGPDGVDRPKKVLEKIFDQEVGYIYRDHTHALKIAKAIGDDWRRVSKSNSFCRFAEKAAGVNI